MQFAPLAALIENTVQAHTHTHTRIRTRTRTRTHTHTQHLSYNLTRCQAGMLSPPHRGRCACDITGL